MKITIYHNQNTIDPSATYSDDSFPAVMASLEAEYTREILKAFPEAEVEFVHEDSTHGHVISGLERQEDEGYEVQHIMETVYEAGNFWS
jgi:hypothetical protein